jgi:hypothetical protein
VAGNVLDGLTARLSRVPAAFADEAAAVFTVAAEHNGGRMMGRYQLTATERKRYVYDQGCTLIMEGVPSGFWAWRETGTRPHTILPRRRRRRGSSRPRVLYGAGLGHPVARVHHPGTRGRRAWTATVDQAAPLIEKALEVALAQAVD